MDTLKHFRRKQSRRTGRERKLLLQILTFPRHKTERGVELKKPAQIKKREIRQRPVHL